MRPFFDNFQTLCYGVFSYIVLQNTKIPHRLIYSKNKKVDDDCVLPESDTHKKVLLTCRVGDSLSFSIKPNFFVGSE